MSVGCVEGAVALEPLIVRGDELPEIDAATPNATIAKNCIWGVPNSDGVYGLAVTDISDTDAANPESALLSAGYVGVTTDGVTMLDFATKPKLALERAHTTSSGTCGSS